MAGYPPDDDGGLGKAFAGFAERHWSWAPPSEATLPTGSVMGGIRLALEAVERAFAAGARTFLLCNPHNPLGRVWSRSELSALADVARRYDARVVADEVHAPMTLPGATFTSYLTVDERTVVVASASKSFNTATSAERLERMVHRLATAVTSAAS